MTLRHRTTTNISTTPLYEIRKSSGKGEGMFATQDIAVGMIIMTDSPVMVIAKDDPTEADVCEAFLELSESQQDQFQNLHEFNRPYKTSMACKYFTNVFGRSGAGDDPDVHSILLTVSKVNHSCTPNATVTTTENAKEETLQAARDIRKGEEIFICYRMDICEATTRAQRRAFLLSTWGFDCDCIACSQNTATGFLSDTRRHLIHALRWKIKYLESLDTSFFTTLDPDVINDSVVLTTRLYPNTRARYDEEGKVYNILLAGLLEAEGLPGQYIARSLYDAVLSLLDDIEFAPYNVVLLGIVRLVCALMRKAIDLTFFDSKATYRQRWREMSSRCVLLDVGVSYLDALAQKPPEDVGVAELAASKAEKMLGVAYPGGFALKFLTLPDGRSGLRCVGEDECKEYVREQYLDPDAGEKAAAEIKAFFQVWKKHMRTGETGSNEETAGKRNIVESREDKKDE